MTKPAVMEDFTAGQTWRSTLKVTVTQDDIIAFARQYDPQDFHTDPEKAKQTPFGRHVASGWHTAAITMRLMLSAAPQIRGGMIGRSVEKLHWPRPVLPGDTLSAKVELLEIRPSKSNPAFGVGRIKTTTENQAGEVVQEMETVILVPVSR